jgi:hypothetical protein
MVMLLLALASIPAPAHAAEPAPTEAPADEDEGALARMWRKVREQRVPVLRADGSRAAPALGAAGAALAIGGLVLAIGGAGALMLWRSAGAAEREG